MKKLILDKETLKDLTTEQLQHANGASDGWPSEFNASIHC